MLFGLWEARDALARGARPVLVEGPLDAIAVTTAGHGHYVGVAPCGTAFTARQATALSHATDLLTSRRPGRVRPRPGRLHAPPSAPTTCSSRTPTR